MQRISKSLSILAVLLLAICCAVSRAQTITGSVNGTVTDPSGAVVPNAQVTATNTETGVATETTTNNDGIYNIRFLQIGNYKVTITAQGFATSTYGPFALETGQNAKIDGKLGLENQQQKVSVEAEVTPLLNTENPTLATTLDTRAIENIPLVGRNLTAITMFLPGSVSTQPNSFVSNAAVSGPLSGNNMSGQASGASVSVNGNRQQANQYLLDGMNVNQTLDDTQGYVPNVDAIGQVQVISANANAEYGNVNGGDILYQTKSGTNNWHGSMFYFVNNYNLDANSWLNNRNGVAKNSYTRNLFGGTFGGPIFKDKLFFFVDYQGGRFHLGGTQAASVYTQRCARETSPNFSTPPSWAQAKPFSSTTLLGLIVAPTLTTRSRYSTRLHSTSSPIQSSIHSRTPRQPPVRRPRTTTVVSRSCVTMATSSMRRSIGRRAKRTTCSSATPR